MIAQRLADRTGPTRFTVPTDAGTLACIRWGHGDPDRPTAVLVHGTGFCASVWTPVAIDLTAEFNVVAIDRRGHGASTTPDDAYELDDFVDDTVAVIDALDLDASYGIGHSAGGTDLLLAAPRRPHAFAGLFVIEPTVMDPRDPTRGVASAPGPDPTALQRFERRRSTFSSQQAAIERLTGRGIYQGWRPDVFDAYISDGFRTLDDGRLTLRCTPATEAAMLRPIAAAMSGTHQTQTFAHLDEIRCPVLIATTEHSNSRYKRMASTAQRHITNATIEHLAGVGHAAPQIIPDRISTIARRFWDDICWSQTRAGG